MPNLDAEVLNEPKKQIVKDFNKEEVVQIIQNAIDKRILDLGDIGGSEVVANPTLEGTESNLEGLEVDGEKYKIPEGTVVEANPTLAGTESPLTGLQVGATKYAVGGGTKLYKHLISFRSGMGLFSWEYDTTTNSLTATQTTSVSTTQRISFTIPDSTPITTVSQFNAMYRKYKPSLCYATTNEEGTVYLISYVYCYENTVCNTAHFNNIAYQNNKIIVNYRTLSLSLSNYTDTVTEL